LVEDEPQVRVLATRLLRAQGYTVVDAEDGLSALQYLSDATRKIDLLLTDAVLPGIGGRELADRARAKLPDLPVLFMSGYATPVLTQQGILRPDIDLLEKPFTAASLVRKVRDVLDRGESGDP
ncbi:MAG TPA: response regulator, partial [Longimicrobiales bacterium]|nr:response regulator [Longimicrobiales bacterium]